MAFFKIRKGGDESIATPQQPESVEVMRRRARHRLIGAIVLVLIGVIGFPLLFDTQPRPISVDIPIDIPDRAKTRPLVLSEPANAPAAPAAPAGSAPAPASEGKIAAAVVDPASSATKSIATASERKPENPSPVPNARPVARPEPTPEPPKPAPKPPLAADDGARAQALLDGQADRTLAVAAEGRFIVQVGAFADAAKAREARLKVERAGLKTYTHVVDTREGKRIRVRVGPFGTRGEADKAAEKIKGLELPAAVLTL